MSLKKRFKEPSTYSGIAGILASVGLLVGPEAAQTVAPVAEAVIQGGSLIASGGTAFGITAIIGGILGVLLPEKDRTGGAE